MADLSPDRALCGLKRTLCSRGAIAASVRPTGSALAESRYTNDPAGRAHVGLAVSGCLQLSPPARKLAAFGVWPSASTGQRGAA
ncbi:hypothetical protein GCM10010172_31650 [Paractinoplanes ferrugineus]|uniref:Uncharacterized protein n=1 Tax=Paractinoplanes ferrugineus TaxID=113564 RepID=A0A919J6X9_9ACTN|nr:hypothetical protein Afe05nite_59830 [Actinoplanes ferrugineus]